MEFVHFVILNGQGDTMVHLISQETLDWINSDIPAFPPGKHGVEDVNVPEAIKAYRSENGETEPFKVSSGSPYNDRMLACPLNMFDDIEVPSHWGASVLSMVAIAEAVQIAGYEVGESLEGHIY